MLCHSNAELYTTAWSPESFLAAEFYYDRMRTVKAAKQVTLSTGEYEQTQLKKTNNG
jgi:hypothetical protein